MGQVDARQLTLQPDQTQFSLKQTPSHPQGNKNPSLPLIPPRSPPQTTSLTPHVPPPRPPSPQKPKTPNPRQPPETLRYDRWGILESVSRKAQASLFLYWGRGFLPIPRRVQITMAFGKERGWLGWEVGWGWGVQGGGGGCRVGWGVGGGREEGRWGVRGGGARCGWGWGVQGVGRGVGGESWGGR